MCFILVFMCDDNRLSIQSMAFTCLWYGLIWSTNRTLLYFLCLDLSLIVPLLSIQAEIEQSISNPASLLSTQLDWIMKTFLFLTFLQLGWTSSLGEDLCQIKKQHIKPARIFPGHKGWRKVGISDYAITWKMPTAGWDFVLERLGNIFLFKYRHRVYLVPFLSSKKMKVKILLDKCISTASTSWEC